ncbi:hypothetical protein B0A48_05132 [Cryoendolithus antarcticus]|uniref:Small ribosomal subunit protein uS9m n=1 Tax=Cryoendolithus antarcticus TaxID=1507870 RepID=A0A1V8TEC8_9PEZI|nr:hypothetical protein B0A48_05132 [Cryoendolithus antarcticus]
METPLIRAGFRRAISSSHPPTRRRALASQSRTLATHRDDNTPFEPFSAAPPIRFNSSPDQFARRSPPSRLQATTQDSRVPLLSRIRILPASPSYFTATPTYTDDLLHLSSLLRKHQLLPQAPPDQTEAVAWKTWAQYKSEVDEPVRETRYARLLGLIKRLNNIHPALKPAEVSESLERFKRTVQPFLNKPKPITVDDFGRARAVGRRKSSSASVYLVPGDGEARVNGQSLTEYFGRLHDRESAVWPLKATERLDRYNVWAVAQGGGTTGQAEAVMLGVSKALLAHEPGLKPALRRAGVVTRDVREVERKKPGHVKARKMPAWVKR